MKKQLLFLMLVSMAGICYSQDQLYKKDNTKLLVKITEVSPDEIKYKLFDNLNGPTYVVNKSEVSLLIYENGKHEVIGSGPENMPAQRSVPAAAVRTSIGMTKADSLKFYKYSTNLSVNFFSFLNMEVGIIYQKDFLKSNCNIVVPLAIGVQKPAITQSVYFDSYNYNNTHGIVLDRKLFEIGIGFNYYPSLRFPVNYYVGPAIRLMQYNCQQVYNYQTMTGQGVNTVYYTNTITNNGSLSRYCATITNGFIFRTRSRLVVNLFGSIGFKNDIVDTKIVDPVTNVEIKPLANPIGLYFWSGFSLGFGF